MQEVGESRQLVSGRARSSAPSSVRFEVSSVSPLSVRETTSGDAVSLRSSPAGLHRTMLFLPRSLSDCPKSCRLRLSSCHWAMLVAVWSVGCPALSQLCSIPADWISVIPLYGVHLQRSDNHRSGRLESDRLDQVGRRVSCHLSSSVRRSLEHIRRARECVRCAFEERS